MTTLFGVLPIERHHKLQGERAKKCVAIFLRHYIGQISRMPRTAQSVDDHIKKGIEKDLILLKIFF